MWLWRRVMAAVTLTRVPDATIAQYESQRRLVLLLLLAARRAWGRVSVQDISGSWAAELPRLLVLLTAAQTAAARSGTDYVEQVLAEQGVDATLAAVPVPTALAGVSANGLSLASVLDTPRIRSLTVIKDGADPLSALDSGLKALERLVVTQVQDAGRVATGVAVAARPAVTGYVRMLNTPSCSRCAVLAGKHYKWNTGFARHPRCDCRHIPAAQDRVGDSVTDPDVYFRSLSESDQRRIFTAAGAQAIRDGADISQVVNARSGMSTAGGLLTTTQGTTRRGLAGGRLRGQQPRLMPEAIYQLAGDDRVLAVNLLRQHGFVL